MTDQMHAPNEARDLPADARFAIRDMLREFEKRRDEILKSARSFTEIRSRGIASDIVDVVGIAKKVGKRIDQRHGELRDPYDGAIAAMRVAVEDFFLPVEGEIDRLTGLLADFDKAEQDRIRRQKDQQRAEQEAMRAERGGGEISSPPDPAPAVAPIKGSYGARAMKTKKVEIRVVDVSQVPIDILNAPRVHEAIAAVARDFAKHRDTIPGLEIDRGETLSVRNR